MLYITYRCFVEKRQTISRSTTAIIMSVLFHRHIDLYWSQPASSIGDVFIWSNFPEWHNIIWAKNINFFIKRKRNSFLPIFRHLAESQMILHWYSVSRTLVGISHSEEIINASIFIWLDLMTDIIQYIPDIIIFSVFMLYFFQWNIRVLVLFM